MGASASKESTTPPKTAADSLARLNEKVPHPRTTSSAAATASLHHAADRLHRIQAEALASSTEHLGEQHQHQRDAAPPTASVALSSIKHWSNDAFALPTSRLASMVLHNADMAASLHNRAAEVADQHIFNLRIPEEGRPVVNQHSSGRCWLFALTNCIRLEVIKHFDLPELELSQAYYHVWDKLEKSNYFLESMVDLMDEPLEGRLVSYLMENPVNDGGQWDMATNLVLKYGAIPKSLYPESYTSSNTGKFNQLLTYKLREYALELRDLRAEVERHLDRTGSTLSAKERHAAVLSALRKRKEAQLAEVYRMIAIAYGEPPKPDEEFTWEYVDRKGKFHTLRTTPVQFQIEHTGSFTAKGSCSLVHDPRREPGKLITVSRLGNVIDLQPVMYITSTPKLMKEAAIRMLRAGIPVFCGSDFGHGVDVRSGIMDPALLGYELAFGVKLGLSKEERIRTGESQMTHATVITGVHLDEQGKPVRWRIENSWGAENVGAQGYMVATDQWFDEWMFQVVIRKEYCRPQDWALFQRGIVEGETEALPPYDPFGALA